MVNTKLNFQLITKITSEPDLQRGNKTVEDFISDPKIGGQLSQADIEYLREYAKKPKLNLKLLTKIKQDPDINTGKKTIEDYINDPVIGNQLLSGDIEHLREYAKGIEEAQLLSKELEKQGIDLEKIRGVRGTLDYFKLSVEDYKKIVPIMLKWITDHKERKHEGLIRILSTPYAKEQAYKLFINEFKNPPFEDNPFSQIYGYKWAVGNGLWVFAGDDIVDELIPLVLDKRNGEARQMIVLGLSKIKKPENKERATDILIKLLDDEDVAGHAIEALGKLKSIKAKPYLERFIAHKKTWWRNAAKKALAKIEKYN